VLVISLSTTNTPFSDGYLPDSIACLFSKVVPIELPPVEDGVLTEGAEPTELPEPLPEVLVN